jgi:hypothetical protein
MNGRLAGALTIALAATLGCGDGTGGIADRGMAGDVGVGGSGGTSTGSPSLRSGAHFS